MACVAQNFLMAILELPVPLALVLMYSVHACYLLSVLFHIYWFCLNCLKGSSDPHVWEI